MGWTFYSSSGQQLRTTQFNVATQADMETATSTAVHVTPGRTQYHPGVAKAWGVITAAGANRSPVYNLAATGDTGTGDRDINFTVAFSSGVFSCTAVLAGHEALQMFALMSFPDASGADIRCTNTQATDEGNVATTLTDFGVAVAFFGDQG